MIQLPKANERCNCADTETHRTHSIEHTKYARTMNAIQKKNQIPMATNKKYSFFFVDWKCFGSMVEMWRVFFLRAFHKSHWEQEQISTFVLTNNISFVDGFFFGGFYRENPGNQQGITIQCIWKKKLLKRG